MKSTHRFPPAIAVVTWLVLMTGLALGQASLPAPEPEWRSEQFSDAASAQLKHLAEQLKSDGAVASDVFEASAQVSQLRPKSLVPAMDDAAFRVSHGGAGRTNDSAAKAMAGLLQPFASGKPERAKFKLFRVDLADPNKPTTRQYAMLAGPSAEGFLEMNATWTIGWAWDGQAAPRIASIALETHEEVLAKSKTRRPFFTEATTAVIGGSPAFREHLRFGTDHWRQRIEQFNRFFKFAHHGLAVGDADGDGLEDLYVCQNGGLPNRLFLQQADGTAKDAAAEAGVDLLDLTRSALFADLDNDGDQDLVLAADTGLLAFRNDGAGRFEAKLRYPKVRNAFSLAAADYDNDGDVDLYVCRYFANEEEGAELAVPVPYFDANNGGGNFLIRNDGPAKNEANWLDFSDATVESGLDGQNNRRFSFAAVWEDLDNDGDQDLFVANDFGLKNLYVNEAGKLRDTAVAAGIDDGGFGMSATSGDYDNDGIMDLYAGNMFSGAGNRITYQPQFRPGLDAAILTRFQRMARGNSLFRGLGAARYADVSESAGVTVGRWSWGSIFADLNNDGWEDLVVTNGFVTGTVPDDL